MLDRSLKIEDRKSGGMWSILSQFHSLTWIKVKVNLSYATHEDIQESGGIAPFILNLDNRW
jgi:hypothetical protein